MKRHMLLRLSLMIIFFFLSKNALAEEAEELNPQRIISLGPAITEEIYLLGVEDRLVGCSVYCQEPPQVKDKEKVGTVMDIDVEKIAILKPDLVLGTRLLDTDDIEKLKKLKIKVITFPTSRNFHEICGQFIELGEIAGKEKEAMAIVEEARDKVDFINREIAGLPKPRVFIQTGARPLYTASKNSFVHDYIVRAGGINIAANSCAGLDYGIYSYEEVIKENPDVIIIVTMGIVGEREKNKWERFKVLNAVKDNRIFIVDSHRLCSPTPLGFAEMLEEIAGLLHPEMKGD